MTYRSCGKEIVFLKTRSGKTIPINAETIQGKETLFQVSKGHVPHFATCEQADTWRKDKGVAK